jgi:hypothetical protein
MGRRPASFQKHNPFCNFFTETAEKPGAIMLLNSRNPYAFLRHDLPVRPEARLRTQTSGREEAAGKRLRDPNAGKKKSGNSPALRLFVYYSTLLAVT